MSFNNKDGFLIVYLMLFLMLVGAIAGGIYISQVKNVHIYVQQREIKKEKEIKALAVDFYKANAFNIDSNSGTILDTGTQQISTYKEIASTTGMPFRDAWNVPYKLYISKRETDPASGFYYHNFYIVCLGLNHKLNTVYNSTTDTIVKGGDDTVIKISGRQIEGEYYVISRNKLFNFVKAVRNYVEALYVVSNKDKRLDFFTSNSCSIHGGGQFGCYVRAKISNTNIPSLLGVTGDMYKDAMGHDFYFDNYSSYVSTTQQPFTARIGMLMPGGYIDWVVFTYST